MAMALAAEDNPHLRELQLSFAVLAQRIERRGDALANGGSGRKEHELREMEALERALAVMQRRLLRREAQLEDAMKAANEQREAAEGATEALKEQQRRAASLSAEAEEARRALASVGGKDWPSLLEENRVLQEAAAAAGAAREAAEATAAAASAAATVAMAELGEAREEAAKARGAREELAKERAELLLDLRSSLRQRATLGEKVEALSEELSRSDSCVASLNRRLEVLRMANSRLEKRAFGHRVSTATATPNSAAGRRSGGGAYVDGYSGGNGRNSNMPPLGAPAVEALVRRIRTKANTEVREARVAAEAARAAAAAAEDNLAAAAAENAALRRRLAAFEQQAVRSHGSSGVVRTGGNSRGGHKAADDFAAAAAAADSDQSSCADLGPKFHVRELLSDQHSRALPSAAAAGNSSEAAADDGVSTSPAGAGSSAAAFASVPRPGSEAIERAVGAALGSLAVGDAAADDSESDFVSALLSADASTRQAVLRLLEEDGDGAAAAATGIGAATDSAATAGAVAIQRREGNGTSGSSKDRRNPLPDAAAGQAPAETRVDDDGVLALHC